LKGFSSYCPWWRDSLTEGKVLHTFEEILLL
jgi:hypothetical protein